MGVTRCHQTGREAPWRVGAVLAQGEPSPRGTATPTQAARLGKGVVLGRGRKARKHGRAVGCKIYTSERGGQGRAAAHSARDSAVSCLSRRFPPSTSILRGPVSPAQNCLASVFSVISQAYVTWDSFWRDTYLVRGPHLGKRSLSCLTPSTLRVPGVAGGPSGGCDVQLSLRTAGL